MLFYELATSQNFPLKHLLQDSTPVSFINPSKKFYFNLGDTFNSKLKPQQFIKKGNKLYLFLNGTGRLYEVSIKNDSIINFKRLDFTDHFGYNIASFGFSNNDVIYNLGGGGIWRVNGQLRAYNNKAKEWDIVKLNKEIPVLYEDNLLWYDMANNKIFIGFYSIANDAIKKDITDNKFVYDVMELDLLTKDWRKLGELSSYLKLNNTLMKPIAMSPWGLIVCIDNKFSLIDYNKNEVLSLEASKENDYQSLQRNATDGNCYFNDSTLYYGSNAIRTLDSISLRYIDFKPTGKPVYTLATTNLVSNYLHWLFFGVAILLAVSIFYLLKYKISIQIIKKRPVNEVKQPILLSPDNNSNDLAATSTNYFEEKELQVLQLIFNNSMKQSTTSIEELNNALGVTRKATDVQKKQRSDVMSSINRKFSFINQNEQHIINKTRTDLDKRSFEYFISDLHLEEVKKIIEATSRKNSS